MEIVGDLIDVDVGVALGVEGHRNFVDGVTVEVTGSNGNLSRRYRGLDEPHLGNQIAGGVDAEHLDSQLAVAALPGHGNLILAVGIEVAGRYIQELVAP